MLPYFSDPGANGVGFSSQIGLSILELGAGVGLPGIAAAKCGLASRVVITDR